MKKENEIGATKLTVMMQYLVKAEKVLNLKVEGIQK